MMKKSDYSLCLSASVRRAPVRTHAHTEANCSRRASGPMVAFGRNCARHPFSHIIKSGPTKSKHFLRAAFSNLGRALEPPAHRRPTGARRGELIMRPAACEPRRARAHYSAATKACRRERICSEGARARSLARWLESNQFQVYIIVNLY